MELQELPPEQLLGPLNEVEKKYAPQRLWVSGDPNLAQETAKVSIVGSRKASSDGLRRARKLASMLAERGVVVVSGLAEGVDSAAHTASMQKGGRTIGVIGTPLDKFYPKANEALQRKIMEEHLCISQFSPRTLVQRRNFPMRNRTMALISDVTVIIEAGESRGSLSQGWEALRLARGLFIRKTLAESRSLKWPAEMLGYGARILALDEFFTFLSESPALVGLDGLPF
jgi:DNA processing protein